MTWDLKVWKTKCVADAKRAKVDFAVGFVDIKGGISDGRTFPGLEEKRKFGKIEQHKILTK